MDWGKKKKREGDFIEINRVINLIFFKTEKNCEITFFHQITQKSSKSVGNNRKYDWCIRSHNFFDLINEFLTKKCLFWGKNGIDISSL